MPATAGGVRGVGEREGVSPRRYRPPIPSEPTASAGDSSIVVELLMSARVAGVQAETRTFQERKDLFCWIRAL